MTFADAREILLPRHRRRWLTRAIYILRRDFRQIGETFAEGIVPRAEIPCSASISWLGTYRVVTYQHNFCADRTIFINPTIHGLDALDVLVHELVHAATEAHGANHGEEFMSVAAAIGLSDTGPTAYAETKLLLRLVKVEKYLGRYPMPEDLIGDPA